MVIDDDENWCFILKMLLKQAGFKKETIAATNGLEGLKKLQAICENGGQLPELILLDLKMPVMDGFGFLEELNKAEELDLSHTRIYICSSSIHPKDRQKAAESYAVSGYITKPLTQEILSSILQ